MTVGEIIHLRDGKVSHFPRSLYFHTLVADLDPEQDWQVVDVSVDCSTMKTTVLLWGHDGDKLTPSEHRIEIKLDVDSLQKGRALDEASIISLPYYDDIAPKSIVEARIYTRNLTRASFNERRSLVKAFNVPLPGSAVTGGVLMVVLSYLLAQLSALGNSLKSSKKLDPHAWVALAPEVWIRGSASFIIVLGGAFAMTTSAAADLIGSIMNTGSQTLHIRTGQTIWDLLVERVGILALIISVLLLALGFSCNAKLKEIQRVADGTVMPDDIFPSKQYFDAQWFSARLALWFIVACGGLALSSPTFPGHVSDRMESGFIIFMIGGGLCLWETYRWSSVTHGSPTVARAKLAVLDSLRSGPRSYAQLLVILKNEAVLDLSLASLAESGQIVTHGSLAEWQLTPTTMTQASIPDDVVVDTTGSTQDAESIEDR